MAKATFLRVFVLVQMLACDASNAGHERVRDAGPPPAADAGPGELPPEVDATSSALLRASDCAQLESWERDAALNDLNELYAVLRSGYLGEGESIDFAQMFSQGSSSEASDYSTTNNQVEGVDEADFIKNDARYIYQVDHGVLRILSAWPAMDTHELSRTPLEGTPQLLLLSGDRVVVFAASQLPQGAPAARALNSLSCARGCGGYRGETLIHVIDVADRSAPRPLRRLEITGNLLAARRIEHAVHAVIQSPGVGFPIDYPYIKPAGADVSAQDRRAMIAEQLETSRARNEQIIRTSEWVNPVPEIRDDDRTYPRACDRVHRTPGSGGSALTEILSFDLSLDEPPAQTMLMSSIGTVYASAERLYLAVPTRSPIWSVMGGHAPRDEASRVHAFQIGADPGAVEYLASSQVPGRVKDQFSMDEYQGNLRIATTSGTLPDPETTNTLSILGPEGELRGQVEHIAPGEDIRSVRFDREHGYLVTFKKTDPLFAFDLSDPTAPRLQGELKIPGFSTYIHLLDDRHLLTIGFDADDHGDFAYFDGVILQLFDVSDPTAPSLMHKLTLGTRGSSSEALSNHLAFNLFHGKLAMPMTICEGGGDGQYGTDMTFSGLILYDVSVERGIRELGRVTNPPRPDGTYDSSLCHNWWQRSRSDVKRSIFMEDFLYVVSQDALHVQDTRALGHDLATLSFAAEP